MYGRESVLLTDINKPPLEFLDYSKILLIFLMSF